MTDSFALGWDASNYDAPPTVRDGIEFYTHKCAEGHYFYKDAEYGNSMANARALGIPVLGAYFVNHPGSVNDQVDWFLQIVNAETPWWRDVPWMFQIDAEKFDYMSRAPSIAEINQFGDYLVSASGCRPEQVVAYAPQWLYGSSLSGIKYKNWASNYGSNPYGHYRELYPGNNSSRWSPANALFLQYGSNTTIGNQATCDANGYRGTVQDLINYLRGSSLAPDTDEDEYMTYRIMFDGSIPGADTTHFYLTNLVNYRMQPISAQIDGVINKLMGTDGTKPDVVVTSASLPTGKDFAWLVDAICGKPVGFSTTGVSLSDEQMNDLATKIVDDLGDQLITHDDIVAATKDALNTAHLTTN